ncbi:MAG: hypothetical protein ABIQ16_08030 [Polyangiaceae bacterium]
MSDRDAGGRGADPRLPSWVQLLRLGARPALDAARAATGSLSLLAEVQISWRVPAATGHDAVPNERTAAKGQQGK